MTESLYKYTKYSMASQPTQRPTQRPVASARAQLNYARRLLRTPPTPSPLRTSASD